jgi:hypothetical protein
MAVLGIIWPAFIFIFNREKGKINCNNYIDIFKNFTKQLFNN